ncbi:MAG: hypothetical protein EPO46_02075 [Lysobacter sp.]|nr:MAG: hypothetical protein EPO46_02075 [Lysobacter sp.]
MYLIIKYFAVIIKFVKYFDCDYVRLQPWMISESSGADLMGGGLISPASDADAASLITLTGGLSDSRTAGGFYGPNKRLGTRRFDSTLPMEPSQITISTKTRLTGFAAGCERVSKGLYVLNIRQAPAPGEPEDRI